MLYTKTDPVGVDIKIQALQTKLYNQLLPAWDAIAWDCYGRCYRNKKDNGYVAEVFTGGTEYRDVYWDDRKDAVSFFGVDPVTKIAVDNTAQVHLVFFVNLRKLKPQLSTRADEEVRQDVQWLLNKRIFGAVPVRVITGIENVLREYPGSYRDERLKFVDMHPVHCFRFDLQVNFSTLNQC